MTDNEKIILEAYELITAFYPELVKQHERTFNPKLYELIKSYEKFEYRHGYTIEKIIKNNNG